MHNYVCIVETKAGMSTLYNNEVVSGCVESTSKIHNNKAFIESATFSLDLQCFGVHGIYLTQSLLIRTYIIQTNVPVTGRRKVLVTQFPQA